MSVKIDRGQAAGLINLTPMIDVVFQLLLFFLVASKFADEERELKVVLPQASEAKPLIAKPQEFFVNVDQQGHYYVGGKSLDKVQLENSLRQVGVNNPGRQSVVIRADKRCQWEFVVAVMNACNKANIRDYRVTTADGKPGT
jgi:biopolymer transport protein ExbD